MDCSRAKAQPAGSIVMQVFVFKNGEFVGTEIFAERQVVVGSDPTVADLVLESAQVSPKHAILEHDGSRIRVRDAGGTNGVFIGNRRIEEQEEVSRLNEVGLGNFSLKVKLVGQGNQREAESRAPERRTTVASSVESRPVPAPTPAPLAMRPDLSDWDDVPDESPVSGRPEPEESAPSFDDEKHNDDDNDEDESHLVPSFSLVECLKQDEGQAIRNLHDPVWVEVLDIQGEEVSSVQMLQPGDGYWIGPELGMFMQAWARELPKRLRLLKVMRDGACRIEMRKEVNGTLLRGGRPMKLDSVPELTKNRRRGTVSMDIKDGEAIDIVDGWHTYHVRFVPPPAELKDPRPFIKRLQPDKQSMRSLGASVASHLIFAILMTLFASDEAVSLVKEKKEEFVEVALEPKQELEPPPEEMKQEKTEAAVEKVAENQAAKPLPKGVRPKAGGTSKAPAGVLGLLSKRGSSAAPGPAAAVAAVSNLLAAKGPEGTSGGYKVSGLQGKLPSNQLSVGGGGGGLLTKGGAALLRGGGGGGGLLAGGAGKRTVGGLVQKDPRAMRSAGTGQLDRDEIQKVINDNIGAIQRCYERELIKAPGLSGKIQVEWAIATSGSVRSARQTFTSMNSTNVSSCIMGAIKTWRFPKPKGGEVIVNYPFIFKSIGF